MEPLPADPPPAAPPPADSLPGATASPQGPTGLADGTRRSLPERSIDADRQAGWITTAVLGGASFLGLLIGLLANWFPTPIDVALGAGWMALMGFFVWLNVRFVEIAHRHKAWRLSDQGIDLWQGVVWRRMTSIPRSRVQHTDVRQGPIQRSFDLATLSVHTAGTEYARVEFEGLDHATALAIRDFLLDREASDGV